MTMWILVANAAEAKLYSTANLRVDKLHLVQEYQHPDSRKKVTDLVSDKPGHYKGDGGARGAFTKGNPKAVEEEHFVLELLKEIKKHCDMDMIKSLVFVVPNGFYKFVAKHLHLSQNHQNKVSHIPKDYTKYSEAELTVALKEHLLQF
jgi:hypothetical protein